MPRLWTLWTASRPSQLALIVLVYALGVGMATAGPPLIATDSAAVDANSTAFLESVLAGAIAVGVGAGAGCIGDTDESEEGAEQDSDNSQGDVGSDVSEETRALAVEMVEAIDDDLSVVHWKLHGMFVPEYADSGGLEADVSILGDAYADIVDQGFDRRAMPTALDDDENVDFMVFLEPEWANAYLDGDWSEQDYYAEIEDSEH